jgi:phosphatidylglycerol---prolipoprotein diacylglyceryl transferase
MPFSVLKFPAFDPVLISIGPFAIRWYALAYIVGILLGWLYARAVIRSERLWGGPAPLTVHDFDDFVLWVTLGIILGGRLGYVLFYNPAIFAAIPLEILQAVEGRHVVPRRLRRLRAGGGAVRARPRGISILSLGDITCAVATIGLFLGRIANFINGELWGRPTDVPWAMVFPGGGPLPRHPSQLYEAALEGLVLFGVLCFMMRAGALAAAGPDCRGIRDRLRHRAHRLRVLSRARPAARIPVGRAHHGHAAVGAADAGGIGFVAAALRAAAATSVNAWTIRRWKPKSEPASKRPGRCRCASS